MASKNPAKKRTLTPETRRRLYGARRFLPLDVQKDTDLRLQIDVYFKDPLVAKQNPAAAIDQNFFVPWEPGLRDGPTSARFAIVDYDASSNTLTSPAVWSSQDNAFVDSNGRILDESTRILPQFRQLSVWATVQHTLDFFESGFALGRRITWGFEGNRLIVVPHAGYGENAFYDRQSKSLQFYWFDREDGRIFTCQSSDIVNHEFGHAVLDGLRPYYYESVLPQTAGFHEFVGDLTAILMAFRNNDFRKAMIKESADLATGTLLSSLAQEFGNAVIGQPYLRTAANTLTMKDIKGDLQPHRISQVLTGACFDIMVRLFGKYKDRMDQRFKNNPKKKPSLPNAFWYTIQRMQMMAIQPLDFLPPCEVEFRDYALAVLRAEEISNPTDPDGYRELMFNVFVERGILEETERASLLEPGAVFNRPELTIYHDIDSIGASRGGAYRFLDDNRADLFIPLNADLVITEIVRARKLTTESRQLPDQIVLQYIWREDIFLEGQRFGRFAGERISMLCGATLVLDQNGNQIHWARKPGSEDIGTTAEQRAERNEGRKRREEVLDTLAGRIESGMIGEVVGSETGLLARAIPPFGFNRVDGEVRFRLSPHFAIHDDIEDDDIGGRQWQVSS